MVRKEFTWENYASVDILATKFKLSKRRIQQLIAELLEQEKAEVVIGVFYDPRNPYARPFYRRLE